MKKVKFIIFVVLSLVLASCKADKVELIPTENNNETIQEKDVAETTDVGQFDENENAKQGKPFIEGEFFDTYETVIEDDVNKVVSNAKSLQDEFDEMRKLSDYYDEMSKNASNQAEMNMASIWTYTVWDKELNSIWKRLNKDLDEGIKKEQSIVRLLQD